MQKVLNGYKRNMNKTLKECYQRWIKGSLHAGLAGRLQGSAHFSVITLRTAIFLSTLFTLRASWASFNTMDNMTLLFS